MSKAVDQRTFELMALCVVRESVASGVNVAETKAMSEFLSSQLRDYPVDHLFKSHFTVLCVWLYGFCLENKFVLDDSISFLIAERMKLNGDLTRRGILRRIFSGKVFQKEPDLALRIEQAKSHLEIIIKVSSKFNELLNGLANNHSSK